MKTLLAGCMLLLMHLTAFSQTGAIEPSFMDPYPLEITLNKTTNLVFPFAVKSVDRGSYDLLVQKEKYADTILQVKAGRENFKETNLSVVTADGRLYSFVVNFTPSPKRLNYLFSNRATENETAGDPMTSMDNEADYLKSSKIIINNKSSIHGVKARQSKIQLQLNGIYVKNNHLYFQLQLKNASNLFYPIEMLRFLVRDKRPAKRTSVHKNLVSKEGEQYKAWLKLDLNQKEESNNYKVEKYHQNYGYDLKKVLSEYPIKELSNADAREMLMKSLEKGNRQSVTIDHNGSEEKFFIRANPRERTIDVFDKQLKPVQSETLKISQNANQGQSVSKEFSESNSKDLKKDATKKDIAKPDKTEMVQKTKNRRMSH